MEDPEIGGAGWSRSQGNVGPKDSTSEGMSEADGEGGHSKSASLHLKGPWEVRASEGASHPLEERGNGAVHAHSPSGHSHKASHQD